MPSSIGSRMRPTKLKNQAGKNKRKRDDIDAGTLQLAVRELDTKATHASFTDLPLSAPTLAGLKSAHFSALTDIQSKAIPLALKGSDILGAAQTGSGKTLAFLIPVLENLYRTQCIGADAGLGAMIVSPTRELAIQIFEVLRKIGGQGHLFAAGLIIGGKSLQEERDALARMNIVVCTPGRILQHLSQTATFNVDALQMLVLDEADRILDMGFKPQMDAIIEYLPSDRQTLLFSATQTKKVSDLARLSLNEPEYISVHEASASATPKTLQQNYVLTPLPEKLDTLFSFLQSSKKSKILVFFSSGKQVRFVYESFRHMQPGIPLLHLHGRQKQTARLDITSRFSQAQHSCLFATDVVARGLDFPAVDWVVQVDCPEDADTYIHRVGRTARYEREGRAILFLDPSEEEGMLARLAQKNVPIERINVRTKKQMSIRNQLQSLCFRDPQLKYLGQKAFVSYVRSIRVQKDREVFGLDRYALEEFAASLGLPGAPSIRFGKVDPEEVRRRKNAPREQALEAEDDGDKEGGEEGPGGRKAKKSDAVRTKYDRMFERRNQDVLAEHYVKLTRRDDDNEDDGRRGGHLVDGEQAADDDGLFAVKQRFPADNAAANLDNTFASVASPGAKTITIPGAKEPLIVDSKRRAKLLASKKALLKLKGAGQKLVFDDEGQAHQVYELEDEDRFRARGAAEEQRRVYLEMEARRIEEGDRRDKEAVREKRREKREKRRARELGEGGGGVEVEGGEDQDALANFIADAEPVEEEVDEGNSEIEERPKEREKKWFEKDVDRDGGGGGAWSTDRALETLDDLEAEAARLLA